MYHIVILNLQRSEDRKIVMEEQFKKLDISNYTFFPCFDGRNVINMSFSVPILKGVGMGRKLAKNEVCLIMSHIGALKHAQIMGYDQVIIFEDDVIICEDWKLRMESLLSSLPENWEYVYLAGHSDYVKLPMFEEPTIIKAPPMIGAFSYMANKIGMQKLIDYCGEFVTTYDDMIMHKIQGGKLTGYLYIPFMTYHRDSPSTLWDGLPSLNHPSIKYFKNRINE